MHGSAFALVWVVLGVFAGRRRLEASEPLCRFWRHILVRGWAHRAPGCLFCDLKVWQVYFEVLVDLGCPAHFSEQGLLGSELVELSFRMVSASPKDTRGAPLP